jgi:hypothetical protein
MRSLLKYIPGMRRFAARLEYDDDKLEVTAHACNSRPYPQLQRLAISAAVTATLIRSCNGRPYPQL